MSLIQAGQNRIRPRLPSKLKSRNTVTSKPYETAFVIGRFQPIHAGHLPLFEEASRLADTVVVLIGSAYEARTPKNPLTFDERKRLMEATFADHSFLSTVKLRVEPMVDRLSNEEWIADVSEKVHTYSTRTPALVGYYKDVSSNYLTWLKPLFHFHNVAPMLYPDTQIPVSATELRDMVWESQDIKLSETKHNMYRLQDIMPPDQFALMKAEYTYIKEYKASWGVAPYPPTFVCSDAVVIQSGHVLLVTRGEFPGKGLFAVPGGYVNQSETVFDAAIRELKEETGLKVPEKVLRGSVFANNVFDTPERSLRGRTISHAFGFKLDNSEDLPRVKGGDDAEKAFWCPIDKVRSMREHFFEDHFHIVDWFINRT